MTVDIHAIHRLFRTRMDIPKRAATMTVAKTE
jgi:hypothetical protein